MRVRIRKARDIMSDAARSANGKSSTPSYHRPIILWGRLFGVVSFVIIAVLLLSVGLPLGWGLGESGAAAIKSWANPAAACEESGGSSR